MILARTAYQKTLENLELKKIKTVELIEQDVAAAMAIGRWETTVRGAIDQRIINHLICLGYKVKIIPWKAGRTDSYGNIFDAYIKINWAQNSWSRIKVLWYRILTKLHIRIGED